MACGAPAPNHPALAACRSRHTPTYRLGARYERRAPTCPFQWDAVAPEAAARRPTAPKPRQQAHAPDPNQPPVRLAPPRIRATAPPSAPIARPLAQPHPEPPAARPSAPIVRRRDRPHLGHRTARRAPPLLGMPAVPQPLHAARPSLAGQPYRPQTLGRISFRQRRQSGRVGRSSKSGQLPTSRKRCHLRRRGEVPCQPGPFLRKAAESRPNVDRGVPCVPKSGCRARRFGGPASGGVPVSGECRVPVSGRVRARLLAEVRSRAFVGWFGRHTFALAVPPSNTGAVRSSNSRGVGYRTASSGVPERSGTQANAGVDAAAATVYVTVFPMLGCFAAALAGSQVAHPFVLGASTVGRHVCGQTAESR